jgi:hypothetical protein
MELSVTKRPMERQLISQLQILEGPVLQMK